ncbi:MAG: M50 family metallopeptidase [Candidatus Micrarchaeia archaeon]|jgi:Zn-dependent protease
MEDYIPVQKKYTFTSREILEIIISVLAISLALTFATGVVSNPEAGIIEVITQRIFQSPEQFTYNFMLFLFAVSPGFVLHEMGHKFTAIKYGCYAEFRSWTFGLLFMFILGIFSGFIFAAPGAVYIASSGYLTKKERGHIASAGAIVNIILSISAFIGIFLLTSLISTGTIEGATEGFGLMAGELFSTGFWLHVLLFSAYINAFLAAFNMVPMHPLDGGKVISYNIGIWLTIVLISLGILFLIGGGSAVSFIIMLMIMGFLFRSILGGQKYAEV